MTNQTREEGVTARVRDQRETVAGFAQNAVTPATGASSVLGPPNKDPESLATQDTFKTKHVAKQDHKGNVAQWVSFMEA